MNLLIGNRLIKVSALSWNSLHQLTTVTPDDILEVTAHSGKVIEDLVNFLEKRYPGILEETATKYLDLVLDSMPKNILPAKEEVAKLLSSSTGSLLSEQGFRSKAVDHFYNQINSSSPKWAVQSMIAMIEFCIGNWANSLSSAGFAQNSLADPNFEKHLYSTDIDEAIEILLASERKKAEILASIISKRRKSS